MNLDEQRRALSFAAATSGGFEQSGYSWSDVPVGIYSATLDMKIWIKGRPGSYGLRCFFTLGDGRKVCATVFRSGCAPSKRRCLTIDGVVDMREAAIGSMGIVTFSHNGKGNPVIEHWDGPQRVRCSDSACEEPD